MRTILTASERRFERYLSACGYDSEKLDVSATAKKTPDYRVSRAGAEAICEVKEFTTSALQRFAESGGQFLAQSPERALAPVRRAIRRAATQLRRFEGSGVSLVVVLSNPHQVAVDLSPHEIAMAMSGDPTFVASITPDGEVHDSRLVYGKHGELADDQAHVSAVVVLNATTAHRPGELSSDADLAATVVESPKAVAGRVARLPTTFFDAPPDQWWSWDESGELARTR